MTKEGSREPTASVQRRLEFGKVVVCKEGEDCKSKCRVMSSQACVCDALVVGDNHVMTNSKTIAPLVQ